MSERQEVITVLTAELNSYGDLEVVTTTNANWKVKKRLENLHPLFGPGRAVKITVKKYKGYDFIDTAEAFTPGAAQPTEQPPQAAEVPPPPAQPTAKPAPTPPVAPQREGLWCKILADLIIAGKVSGVLGKENTISALQWFRGELVSVLKIPFDGSKFPVYKAPEEREE